ncbi:hypothetical protein ACFY7Z_25950 [Streptomyces sp. NPDC012623]|uniref:hypothetical protein n=1 Tax=unclassified Streptomyces TaxID=2593676 RepID=UPI0036AD7E41
MSKHIDRALAPALSLPEQSGRRRLPAPTLLGFVLLLAVMFGVSYAVGHAVGPVAPGMHGSSSGGGADGHGDESGSGDMGGMEMDHGSGR